MEQEPKPILPAFPTNEKNPGYEYLQGMSLRDYFAAHCPSDLAKVAVQKDAERIIGPMPENDIIAKVEWNMKVEAWLRYQYADAMLKARQ